MVKKFFGTCSNFDTLENISEKNGESYVNETLRMWSLHGVFDDPTAVTRDFPRIPVYVSTDFRNNYCEESEHDCEKSGKSEKGILLSPSGVKDIDDSVESNSESTLFLMQSRRVRIALELIMELCGEDAKAMQSVWQNEQKKISAANISFLLFTVLLKTGMMRDNGDKEKKEAIISHNDSISQNSVVHEEVTGKVANSEHSCSGKETFVECPLHKYIPESKTLRVMQYMVQSLAFISIQSLLSILHFSWCKKMQDITWVVHVHQKKGVKKDNCVNKDQEEKEETLLIVQHKQTLRHYVERKNVRVQPRFEIDWVCTITIDPQHILCGSLEPPKVGENAEVRHVDAMVLSARVEAPPKIFCLVSRTWRRRRDVLAARLKKQFQVKLSTVSALKDPSTHFHK